MNGYFSTQPPIYKAGRGRSKTDYVTDSEKQESIFPSLSINQVTVNTGLSTLVVIKETSIKLKEIGFFVL